VSHSLSLLVDGRKLNHFWGSLNDLLVSDDGHMFDDLLHLGNRYVNDPLHGLDLGHLYNSLDMLDLGYVDFDNLLLHFMPRNMPHNFPHFHWAWDVNVAVDDLYLRHFYDSFHVLNLRNVNLNNLFFGNEFWHMPDILNRLDRPRYVNMPLDHLDLRNLHDSLDVLHLRDRYVNHLFLGDDSRHVPYSLLYLWLLLLDVLGLLLDVLGLGCCVCLHRCCVSLLWCCVGLHRCGVSLRRTIT